MRHRSEHAKIRSLCIVIRSDGGEGVEGGEEKGMGGRKGRGRRGEEGDLEIKKGGEREDKIMAGGRGNEGIGVKRFVRNILLI